MVYTDVELIKGYTSELEERQQSMNITIAHQANKIQNQEIQHQIEMDKLYKIVNNLRDRLHKTENHYEEELTKAYVQTDIILDEELKTPEEKEEQRKIDVRIHKRATESCRKEKEKEAAKTPEQKAEEKEKIDKQFKKLKESMQ